MTTRAVGIDLGTTFSAIAHVNKHGVPEILHNAEGDRITPSVLLFDGEEVLVGNYAKQSAVVYPERVVQFAKRYMGDEEYRFHHGTTDYTPERLSAFILSKLKHEAEVKLGHRIDRAVITVPAHFGEAERQATIRAGEIAGLQVLQLVNEPTAAAFAYGLERVGEDQQVLVFDLGGGTFDVTIIRIEGKDLTVVATAGDHQLGGKDWDDALIQFAAARFEERHGIDPLEDQVAYHDLRQKCVSAKLSLTRRPSIQLFFDTQGKVMREEVTREGFEDLTAPLLKRCESLVLDVLEDAGLVPEAIDTVLLAGGATRMPMVREMLETVFGRPPSKDIHPDECVALGAALTAAILAADADGADSGIDVRTHDVTSHSLGMVVYRDAALFNSKVIARNARIPSERTRDEYVTTHDGQTTMDLWLVQGENESPLECAVLGHFEFYGIPPRPAGDSSLSVTFRYNANGIVEVEAMDLKSGQTLPHRLAKGAMTLEDLVQNRAPIHMALLMDCSGSMYGQSLDDARSAARDFAHQSLQPGRQLAVVAFPGGIVCPLSADPMRVSESLETLSPIGSTPLALGLRNAQEVLAPQAGVQRVFIILTDGQPDDPEDALAEVHRIRSNGGRVITVGVGPQVRPEYLRSLASNRADYHFCNESVELKGTFTNLATELTSEATA